VRCNSHATSTELRESQQDVTRQRVADLLNDSQEKERQMRSTFVDSISKTRLAEFLPFMTFHNVRKEKTSGITQTGEVGKSWLRDGK
jgi:hypothetical protein